MQRPAVCFMASPPTSSLVSLLISFKQPDEDMREIHSQRTIVATPSSIFVYVSTRGGHSKTYPEEKRNLPHCLFRVRFSPLSLKVCKQEEWRHEALPQPHPSPVPRQEEGEEQVQFAYLRNLCGCEGYRRYLRVAMTTNCCTRAPRRLTGPCKLNVTHDTAVKIRDTTRLSRHVTTQLSLQCCENT